MARYKYLSVICISVILGISIIFSGCSKKKEGTIVEKKKKIRYANWEVYPAQLKLHQEVVDRFREKHPDIDVEFEIVQGGPNKILIEIAGGSAPDVFYWCDTILPPLVEKKSVIDLMPFIEKDKDINLGMYFPKVVEGLQYNGGLYGLPIYFGSNALVYNKDLFDKEGIKYPNENWAWDDFLQAAARLTKREENGRVIQYGALPPDYNIVIRTFGGEFFDKDGTKPLLDSPQTRDAFQFLLDLQDKHKVATSMRELEGEDKFRSGVQMFMTNRIGMFIAPSFILATLDEIKAFKWDVAPMPVRKGYPRVSTFATGNVSISSQCKNPQAAWEFAKFMAGIEGTGVFGKGRNCIPPIKEVAYETFVVPPPDNIKVFVEAIEYALPILKVTWADEYWNTVVRPETDLLFLGKQSIDETIKKITKGANKYLEK